MEKMENLHPIDSLFRDKLREKGNDFQEEHWEMLLKELEGKKKRRLMLFWRYAALLAIVAVGGWYVLNQTGSNGNIAQSEQAKSPIIETVESNKNKAEEADQKINDQVALTESESLSSKDADDIPVKASTAEAIASNEQVVVQNNDTQKLQSKGSKVSTDGGEISKTSNRIAGKIEEAKDPINPIVTTSPSSRAAVPNQNPIIEDENLIVDFDLTGDFSGSVELTNEIKVGDGFSIGVEEDPLKTSESANELLSYNEFIDRLDPMDFDWLKESSPLIPERTIKSKKVRKGYLSIGPGFLLGRNATRQSVAAASSFDASAMNSAVSEEGAEEYFAFDNSFNMTGLDAAYHFNDHWDLSVGAYYGHKRFFTGDLNLVLDDYQTATRVIEVYNNVLDIPISLGYTFGNKYATVRPFVRAGVSLSSFNGVVKSSVAYDPYRLTTIEVFPDVVSVEPNEVNPDDSYGPGPAGVESDPSPEIDNADPGPQGPEPSEPEPLEPELVDVYVPSTYGESAFVEDGRLYFDNKVKKLLPLYGMVAAGVDFRLSNKLNLRLSGQYKMTRKGTVKGESLTFEDPTSEAFDPDNLAVSSRGLGSEKGFRNVSALLSLHYRFD